MHDRSEKMKYLVRFIEVGETLRMLSDVELDTEMLPIKGDIVWLYDQKRRRRRQFSVIERHWNIGDSVGIIEILVCETVEGAKTI